MKRRMISALATGLFVFMLLVSTPGISSASVDDHDKAAPSQKTPGKPITPGAAGDPEAPRVPAGSGFTYQGSLKDGGNPANGQYDMQFTLYDALSGGSQVGSAVILMSQTVTDGLFAVQLDFGASAFQGSSRWLEIAVKPAGGGGFTTLSPRQLLTAAPLAMSLVPGAVITGTTDEGASTLSGNNSGNGSGVLGVTAAGASDSSGVRGEATGVDGNGVIGMANNGSNAWGVYGSSNAGIGVYGYSGGNNKGAIVGENFSGFGILGNGYTGVSGTGTYGDGIRGLSDTGFGGNFRSNHSYGVYAQSDNEAAGVFSSTNSYGVFARTVSAPAGAFNSTTGPGVVGSSNAGLGGSFSSSTNVGVYSASDSGLGGYFTSNTSAAIYGLSNGSYTAYFGNENGNGLVARSNHSDSIVAIATYTDTAGVSGRNSLGYGVSGSGITGVMGTGTSGRGGTFTSNTGDGVNGFSSSGTGVAGVSGGSNAGVYGTSSGGYGVYGIAQTTNGGGTVGENPIGFGVIGNGFTGVSGTGTNGDGVRGLSNNGFGGNFSSNHSYGVYARSDNEAAGVFSSTTSYGVFARTVSAPAGVFSSTSGYGVHGTSNSGIGVIGDSVVSVGGLFDGAGDSLVAEDPTYHCSYCYAGVFGYDVQVNGTLYANAKSFKIDDPLDPANKYLIHTSVESPDMLNIYRGHVTLDGQGTAWVQMPDYFQALNQDFDYQLTAIGKAQPNLYVAQEIKDNKFQIAGGVPGAKVSWQVTGVRHDPYANAYRTPVEQAKSPQEKGLYLNPELYNQPDSKDISTIYTQDNTKQPEQPKPAGTGNK